MSQGEELPEYDVHPLDRDYSDDLLPKSSRKSPIKKKLPFDQALRRNGAIIFLVGMGILIVTAIILGSTNSATRAESLASFFRTIGMYVMLIGAVAVMVAYQKQKE